MRRFKATGDRRNTEWLRARTGLVIGPGRRGTVHVIAVVIAVATVAFYPLTEKFA